MIDKKMGLVSSILMLSGFSIMALILWSPFSLILITIGI